MMVCSSCGAYIVPEVNKEQQTLTCTDCLSIESVKILPLFIITGASGVGKTTVVTELRKVIPDFDIFDTDIMWAVGDDWQLQRNNWLRVAYSIAQSNRGTILCGTMMPEEILKCDHYPLFKHVYFLNLHCDDTTRELRLKARPEWRQSGSDEWILQQKRFAQWLIEISATAFDPPMPTVDTSNDSVQHVAHQIKDWVQKYWISALKMGSGGKTSY